MGSLFSRWVLPTGLQTLRTFFLVLSSSSRPPACPLCLAESPGSDRLSLRNPVALCHPLAGPSAPILAQAEWHLPPGPVSPHPCPGRAASPTRACPPLPLPRQSSISHRGLSAPTPPGSPPACFTVAPPCLPSRPWWPRSPAPRPWPAPLEGRPPPALTCLAPPQTSVETRWPSSQLRPCCLHPSLASAPSRG